MTAVLVREGWSISRQTVQGYMREMGIAGIAPGRNTRHAAANAALALLAIFTQPGPIISP